MDWIMKKALSDNGYMVADYVTSIMQITSFCSTRPMKECRR